MKGNKKSNPCKKFLNLPKCVVDLCQSINILPIDKGETLGDGVAKLAFSTIQSLREASNYKFCVVDKYGELLFHCQWTNSSGSISSIDEKDLHQYDLSCDDVMDDLLDHLELTLKMQCPTPKDVSMFSTFELVLRSFLFFLRDGKLRGLEKCEDDNTRWYLHLEGVKTEVGCMTWTWPDGSSDTFCFGEVPSNVTWWDDSQFLIELESLKTRRFRRKRSLSKALKSNPSKSPPQKVSDTPSIDPPIYELEF